MENVPPSKPPAPGKESHDHGMLMVVAFLTLGLFIIISIMLIALCICMNKGTSGSIASFPIARTPSQSSMNNVQRTVACTYFNKVNDTDKSKDVTHTKKEDSQLSHDMGNKEMKDENGFSNVPLDEDVILIQESSSTFLFQNTYSEEDNIQDLPGRNLTLQERSCSQSPATVNCNPSLDPRPQSIILTPAMLDVASTSYSPVYNPVSRIHSPTTLDVTTTLNSPVYNPNSQNHSPATLDVTTTLNSPVYNPNSQNHSPATLDVTTTLNSSVNNPNSQNHTPAALDVTTTLNSSVNNPNSQNHTPATPNVTTTPYSPVFNAHSQIHFTEFAQQYSLFCNNNNNDQPLSASTPSFTTFLQFSSLNSDHVSSENIPLASTESSLGNTSRLIHYRYYVLDEEAITDPESGEQSQQIDVPVCPKPSPEDTNGFLDSSDDSGHTSDEAGIHEV